MKASAITIKPHQRPYQHIYRYLRHSPEAAAGDTDTGRNTRGGDNERFCYSGDSGTAVSEYRRGSYTDRRHHRLRQQIWRGPVDA